MRVCVLLNVLIGLKRGLKKARTFFSCWKHRKEIVSEMTAVLYSPSLTQKAHDKVAQEIASISHSDALQEH